MEWKDELDLESPRTPGKPRHLSGNEKNWVSTIFALDTNAYESMYCAPGGVYRLLQIYESAEEARKGHIFWAKKIKEGFVPEDNLVDNFDITACLNFITGMSTGQYDKPLSKDKTEFMRDFEEK